MLKVPGYPYFELIFFFFFFNTPGTHFPVAGIYFHQDHHPHQPTRNLGSLSRHLSIQYVFSCPLFPLLHSLCLLISSPVCESCLKLRVVLLALSLQVALITKVCDFCRFYIILSGHSVFWVSLSFRPSMCFVLIILAAWYFRLCWSSLNCITIVFSEASVAALVDNRHLLLCLQSRPPTSSCKPPLPAGLSSPSSPFHTLHSRPSSASTLAASLALHRQRVTSFTLCEILFLPSSFSLHLFVHIFCNHWLRYIFVPGSGYILAIWWWCTQFWLLPLWGE